MSKETKQRFAFINQIVGWEGQVNATHISSKFQLSRQAASSILKQYREQFPTHLEYDSSQKAYVATEAFNYTFIGNNGDNSFSQYLTAIASASAIATDPLSTMEIN